MPFKCARPEERAGAAASASSSAASAFYNDGQSASYTTQANAAIQRDLTRHALELLRFGTVSPTSRSSPSAHPSGDEDGMWLLLDLGAGSGLSTLAANEWLLEQNLLGFTMAFDISASMLSLTASSDQTSKDQNEDNKGDTDALCLQRAGFYRGNAAQRFPLRGAVFHAAIGISMLQWLTKEGLETCFASLRDQLIRNSSGHSRAVFQVYPSSIEYVDLMEKTAKKMGFRYAEVFVAFPHSTTAKKWYFCVDKHGNDSASALEGNKGADSAHTLCLFGRRFHRRCAWHLLQSKKSDAVDALRDRLGREHVKTAWHIWRKFRRSITGNAQAAVHAKAKRSLELWKSDEVIGKALQTRFVPRGSENEEGVNAVTYELLLSQMDNVVDILHTAYTEAVEIERSIEIQA
uniref:Methyltransferase type 11 domain-containing protein n=1 Tax=Globisporangium ultimum (strain ATCC 200006 / CBS 805.95 / DAOM BR144) TaxID=431595 RepID=K3WEN4_GLOUD